MGATLKYVKEFCFGGSVNKPGYKSGGSVEGKTTDVKQDKKMIATAVHKHEKAQHPGKPLTKLKKGGPVVEKATGERYPSREAMVKHEAKETPREQREELVQRVAVKAPARRSVPVAPSAPLLAMKTGGLARPQKVGKVMGEFKAGELKSSSGAKVTNPKQAIAIGLSEARAKR